MVSYHITVDTMKMLASRARLKSSTYLLSIIENQVSMISAGTFKSDMLEETRQRTTAYCLFYLNLYIVSFLLPVFFPILLSFLVFLIFLDFAVEMYMI